MSAEGYYLIAHCVNATDSLRAEVEWEVASEAADGRWFTNDGHEVWPFATFPIDQATPAIPEGWIEHLHELAQRMLPPRIDLATALGLRQPAASALPPLPRRL